jgi:hypothetical protein
MYRYEYACPVHGVVVSYRRNDPTPSAVPITCSNDMHGERLRFGERLHFRVRWATQTHTHAEPQVD